VYWQVIHRYKKFRNVSLQFVKCQYDITAQTYTSYEQFCLLGCDVMQCGWSLPTFRRNVLLPSSGLNSKQPVRRKQQATRTGRGEPSSGIGRERSRDRNKRTMGKSSAGPEKGRICRSKEMGAGRKYDWVIGLHFYFGDGDTTFLPHTYEYKTTRRQIPEDSALRREKRKYYLHPLRWLFNDAVSIETNSVDNDYGSALRKPSPVSLCPPLIPHELTWARTRAAAVGRQQLTAWGMART
jgi:hypothetical protein